MTSPTYGSSGYNKDSKYGGITITSQHDVRNLDGSSKWGQASIFSLSIN